LIGLDTNVLLRYFAQDDPRQSPVATRFVEEALDSDRPGHVSLVTLAELMWVVRTRFDAPKKAAVDIVSRLLGDRRFVVQAAEQVWAALDAYQNLPVDFSDALIAALDRSAGCDHTVTFDRHATHLTGIRLLRASP
jgi:predicted nucleic-acid-binding protein